MPEDLQQLLTRINDDYLKQAENRKLAVLDAAKHEAETIVATARKEAERLVEDARKQADALRARQTEEIKRVCKDSVRELRGEFLRLLTAAVGKNATEAMTPAFMADLIRQMAEAAPRGEAAEAAILANERLANALRELVPGTIRAEIKAGAFKGGMQISFDASGEYFDFSDQAVQEFLRDRLGRELGRLLDAKS